MSSAHAVGGTAAVRPPRVHRRSCGSIPGEATIVRARDDRFPVEHVGSDVPVHHRSTGHVRHDPTIRHGGGRDQHADEPRRAEHLGQFLADVARRLDGEPDVVIVGPGEVREHLARLVRGPAGFGSPDVLVHTEPASRMTDRQLIALLRELNGHTPRRGRRAGDEPPASWEPDVQRSRRVWTDDRRRRRIARCAEPATDSSGACGSGRPARSAGPNGPHPYRGRAATDAPDGFVP